jgi:hypothetical protein
MVFVDAKQFKIRLETMATLNRICEWAFRSSDRLGLSRRVALEINFALWIMIGCVTVKAVQLFQYFG